MSRGARSISRVYAFLVAMHPAAFRHEFGLEMRLDFEEARKSHGVMPLYWDALVSVSRQWGRTGVAIESDQVPAAARFLLDGRYGVIGGDRLSAFEFGRGLVLAVGLIGGLLGVQGHARAAGDLASAPGSGSAKGGFSPDKAERGDYSGGKRDRGRFPQSVGGPASQVSGARPFGELRAGSGTPNSAPMKAAFVLPMRIGETGAGREVARAEEARRLGVIVRSAASVGTPGLVEESGRAAGTIPHPSDKAGRMGHPVPVVRTNGQILHATAPLPSFEVVSIRLWHRPPAPPPVAADQPGAPKPVMRVDPGSGVPRVTSPRVHFIIPGGTLIATAYGMPPDSKRVVGGPAWLREDDPQFEITAKIGDEMFAAMQKMTPAEQQAQMRLMQQSLLTDRFGLKLHFEQREMTALELQVAKGGPKLTAAGADEKSFMTNFADERGGGIRATAVTLDQLAHSPLLLGGRVVQNKTGLTGAYDFTLRFAGESGDGDAPGLYTALQDQLGLRLVPTKGMVEVLVIDSVEKPSEN